MSIQRNNTENVLIIWCGAADNDYMLVRDLLDWQYWREDKHLMEKAAAYGRTC